MKRWLFYILGVMVSIGLPSCGGASGHGGEGDEHEEHEHGHEHGGNEVELSKAQMDAVGIRLGTFEARSLSESVSATGRLEISASDEGVAAPKVGGRVSRLLVSEGQRVRSGQVVAYIDAPELAALRSQIREAAVEVESALTEVRRQEALASQGAGIRKNLDNARSALRLAETRVAGLRRQLAAYGVQGEGEAIAVKAPLSGVVTSVEVAVGGYADASMPVAKIVNNDAVFCMLQVLEKDISNVRAGMAVDIQLTNDPSRSFVGKVVEVMPMFSQDSHTVPVKVSFTGDRSGVLLLPGMAVSGRISGGGTLQQALPEGAVVSAGGRSFIFVLEEHDEHEEGSHEDHEGEAFHFEKVEVSVGATALGYTAVTPLEALPEGTKVVVAGAFYLNSMVSDHGEHNH